MKSVLIVDDSRLARLTLRRLLAKHQVEVFEAEGVLDAESWLARNTLPDVIFMDIMMPELDGYAGLARLREKPDTRNLPVIMYSGDVSEEARQKARDAGATGYLPKPATADRLDALMASLVERVNISKPATPPPAPVGTPKTIDFEGVNLSSPRGAPSAPVTPPPVAPIIPEPVAPVVQTPPPPPPPPVAPVVQAPPVQVAPVVSAPSVAPVAPPSSGLNFQAPAGLSDEDLARIKAIETRLSALENRITALENKPAPVVANSNALPYDDRRVEALEDQVKERWEELDHRLTVVERKPTMDNNGERQHRDIVFLQKQLVDAEKQNKMNMGLGIGGLVLGLLSIIWHIF